MRFIFITLLVFTSSQFATAQSLLDSACFNEFSALQKWSTFTPIQIQCLNESSEFTQSMSILCSEDQSKFSLKYIKFLELEKKYLKAVVTYQVAKPADRNLASVEMQFAKQAMDIIGNDGIYQSLNFALQEKFRCIQ